MLSHTRRKSHIQSDTLPLQQAGAIVMHCSSIAEGQQGHSETEHWARAGSPPTKAVILKRQLNSPDFAKIFQSIILAFQFTSMYCPLQLPPQTADKWVLMCISNLLVKEAGAHWVCPSPIPFFSLCGKSKGNYWPSVIICISIGNHFNFPVEWRCLEIKVMTHFKRLFTKQILKRQFPCFSFSCPVGYSMTNCWRAELWGLTCTGTGEVA